MKIENMEKGEWSPHLMWIRTSAEKIGKDLGPNDDWMPTVFVEGTFPADFPNVLPEQIGKEGMIILGLAGGFMDNDTTKDFVAFMMTRLAKKLKATGMTFLCTCWMSQPPHTKEDDMPEGLTEEQQREFVYARARAFGPPSKDPNRKERLMMLSVYYGGVDDGTKFIFADIKREKDKPPVLYNWNLIDATGEMEFMGRFSDAIYEGLKLARED